MRTSGAIHGSARLRLHASNRRTRRARCALRRSHTDCPQWFFQGGREGAHTSSVQDSARRKLLTQQVSYMQVSFAHERPPLFRNER